MCEGQRKTGPLRDSVDVGMKGQVLKLYILFSSSNPLANPLTLNLFPDSDHVSPGTPFLFYPKGHPPHRL